jgi:threonine/homoserine/homoserine lactone efflux protein
MWYSIVTMDLSFFLKGMIVGAAITAPIGPIGILCVNRTLSNGRMSGFVSGLGAVTGDGFYAAVAAYGITLISSFLSVHHAWFRLAGGIFLFLVGLRIFRARPCEKPVTGIAGTLMGDYASAVILTISNPVTVVAFAAAFAALGLGGDKTDELAPTAMVSGVVAGATLCWFLLAGAVSVFREKIDPGSLRVVNRVAGSAILVFAAAILFFWNK